MTLGKLMILEQGGGSGQATKHATTGDAGKPSGRLTLLVTGLALAESQDFRGAETGSVGALEEKKKDRRSSPLFMLISREFASSLRCWRASS